MAKEKIIVKIDKNTGNSTVLVENLYGKSCADLTEDLEVQLGKVTAKEFTADYHKPEPPSGDSWVTNK